MCSELTELGLNYLKNSIVAFKYELFRCSTVGTSGLIATVKLLDTSSTVIF